MPTIYIYIYIWHTVFVWSHLKHTDTILIIATAKKSMNWSILPQALYFYLTVLKILFYITSEGFYAHPLNL